MNRYFINDFGLVNAMGSNKADVYKNWQLGISPGMEFSHDFYPERPCYVARVTDALPEIPDALWQYRCRNNQLLLAALDQCRPALDNIIKKFGSTRVGIVLGTSTSGISRSEEILPAYIETGNYPPDYHFKQQDIGSGTEFIGAYTGIDGPAFIVSTACSSSGNAFATARRLMEQDICDAVLVGGADSLCKMTVQGFASLESIGTGVCKPFSKNRNGITIGEAAALFILSKEASDIEFFGIGCTSDAHHISAPDPEGHGAIKAMQEAFKGSPFSTSDLDYLNLHGTATPLNDAMESKAVYQVFGKNVVCSSTKSLTGHTLGAAAATELALCLLLLANSQQPIPAHVWDGVPDADIADIKLSSGNNSDTTVTLCLSNSFAFGGNNTSILAGHRQENRKG